MGFNHSNKVLYEIKSITFGTKKMSPCRPRKVINNSQKIFVLVISLNRVCPDINMNELKTFCSMYCTMWK